MFIQTEATPDPARLRFLPGCEVLTEGRLDLRDKAQAAISPLAALLFTIPDVAAVSLDGDSITVTRSGGDWRHLKPAILAAIAEHFMSGAPALTKAPAPRQGLASSDGEAEAHDRLREALRRVIDPELGYNIVDLGLVYDIATEEGGVVHVTMTTTTPGCPATNYLKGGAGDAVSTVPGVEFVDVKLTYEPRWTPEMMSSEAKAHFGIREDGRR